MEKKKKKIDPKLITRHAVTLTHREDLQLFTRLEQTQEKNAEGKSTYIRHHGARQMSGKLVDAAPQYGTLVLDHEQLGAVKVSVGYHTFSKSECAMLEDAAEEKRHVDLALDKTGTKLTVNLDNGLAILKEFPAPLPAYNLSDREKVSPENTIQGKLMTVNAENTVELRTEKGPTIVYASEGASSVTTLKKLVGKQVEVGANRDGKLQVKGLELDKSRGR